MFGYNIDVCYHRDLLCYIESKPSELSCTYTYAMATSSNPCSKPSIRYHKTVYSEMSKVNYMFIIVLLLVVCSYLVADNMSLDGNCPIWHIRSSDVCECGANLEGAVKCDGAHNVVVVLGSCVTWDNVTVRL